MSMLHCKAQHVTFGVLRVSAMLLVLLGALLMVGGGMMLTIPGYGAQGVTGIRRVYVFLVGANLLSASLCYLTHRKRIAMLLWTALVVEVIVLFESPLHVRAALAVMLTVVTLLAWWCGRQSSESYDCE